YAVHAFDALLTEERQFLANQRKDYLIHEHLSEYNEPLYFRQFVERAEESGLQYLCEAEYSTTVLGNFAGTVQELLASVENVIDREQILDFVRNRTFRQTLVCRAGVNVNKSGVGSRIKHLYIGSPSKPT